MRCHHIRNIIDTSIEHAPSHEGEFAIKHVFLVNGDQRELILHFDTIWALHTLAEVTWKLKKSFEQSCASTLKWLAEAFSGNP